MSRVCAIGGVAGPSASTWRERLTSALHAAKPAGTSPREAFIDFGGAVIGTTSIGDDVPFRVTDEAIEVMRGMTDRDASWREADGEFAVVSWDRDGGVLTLARDDAGARMLYVAEEEGHVLFATDLRIAAALRRARPSAKAIRQYLLFNHPLGDVTWYDEVVPLAAGITTIRWRDGAPSYSRSPWAELAPATSFEGELRDVLLARAAGERPAFHLSGGIDSSLLCHLFAERAGTPIMITSTDGDESRDGVFARLVAAELGGRTEEVPLDAGRIADVLDDCIAAAGSPLMAIGVPTFSLIAARLHELGLRRVVSGIGGDHAFVGWNKLRHGGSLFDAVAHVEEMTLREYLVPDAAEPLLRALRADVAARAMPIENEEAVERFYFANFLLEHLRMADAMHAHWGVEVVSPFLGRAVMRLACELAAADENNRRDKGFLRAMLHARGSAAARRSGKEQMALSLAAFREQERPRMIAAFDDRQRRLDVLDYDRLLALARSNAAASKSELRLLTAVFNIHVWLAQIARPAPPLLGKETAACSTS